VSVYFESEKEWFEDVGVDAFAANTWTQEQGEKRSLLRIQE
jgi:hypothetical protein